MASCFTFQAQILDPAAFCCQTLQKLHSEGQSSDFMKSNSIPVQQDSFFHFSGHLPSSPYQISLYVLIMIYLIVYCGRCLCVITVPARRGRLAIQALAGRKDY